MIDPLTLAAIFGGLLFFGGRKKGGSSVSAGGGFGVTGPEDRLAWLNGIRGMSFWVTDTYNTMPGLADFLTVVGFAESRFNPSAANPEISTNWNAARGLFGMRPSTAELDAEPDLLFNPYWAFVTAVDHAAKAIKAIEREQSGVPNWMAIRRWWAIPSLVHDFNEDKTKSGEVRGRFERAIFDCNAEYGTSIDPNFIWFETYLGGYPGRTELMRVLNLIGVA